MPGDIKNLQCAQKYLSTQQFVRQTYREKIERVLFTNINKVEVEDNLCWHT